MTPEKRAELTTQLAANGLTVLLTKDFDAIMLQLAHLAQFERLLLKAAAGNPPVEFVVEHVQSVQHYPVESRPMEILDIPWVLMAIHRALYEKLDKGAQLRPERLYAASAAFTGIICADAVKG